VSPQAVSVEQHEPRRRRARAPDDDEIPRRETERSEQALGRPYDEREGLGARAGCARERPAARRTLERDERVERVDAVRVRDARDRDGEREDEATAAR
jgi:hypothetical protein